MSRWIQRHIGKAVEPQGSAPGQPREAAIVTVLCSQTRREFFVRFDPIGAGWLLAAVVRPPRSAGPGTAGPAPMNRTLQGQLVMGVNYPGCPYCRQPTIVKCGGCGAVRCAPPAEEQPGSLCPSCETWGRRGGNIDRLDGSAMPQAPRTRGGPPRTPLPGEQRGRLPRGPR